MPAAPRIGPIALCTVVSHDIDRASSAYAQHLGLRPGDAFTLDESTAAALALPEAVGARARMLANAAGRRWLLQVECPQAAPRDALSTYGWLSQEIAVEDVDALAAALDGSPFTVLRPPRDLDMSSLIRACQVRGPDGEILYLTQVNGEVPGSELPQNSRGVDHLFIAVLSTPDRDATLRHFEAIAGNEGINFETRISVVNQHRGWDLERKHPIATLQLAGRCLIEIDGLPETQMPPTELSAGTAAIAFIAAGEAPDTALRPQSGPLAGYAALPQTGLAGERYTLLYPLDPADPLTN